MKRPAPVVASIVVALSGWPIRPAEAAEGAGAEPAPQEQRGFKHLSLTSDDSVYLSLSGEIRERFEYYSEPFFGLRGVEEYSYLLHRLLLGADLHVGEHVRVFLQFGNHLEGGKNSEDRSPTDVDEFDIQQGFVDLYASFGPRRKLTLRAGRHEMNFGSGRLIAVREGANIRRSFDGVRVTFANGDATFDAFAVRTVNLKVGVLNDDPNPHEALWGFYGVVPWSALPDGHADLYYLGLQRDDAIFQQGVADELRHSFGTRLWGKPGAWDYNYEAVLQTGSFGGADILAWTVATDTGYTFQSTRFKPRIGLKVDIASGDKNPNDDQLGTFNALFPKQPYFSEASLIAPANLIDVHPSLFLELTKAVSFTTDVDFFWKHRIEDAIYTPPGRPLVPAGRSNSHYIGSQVNAELGWQLSKNASFTLYYSHFFSGPAVTEAGGREVDFVGTWLTVRF